MAAAPGPATVIAAMHAQYEVADRNYQIAERAQSPHEFKSSRYNRLGDALQDLQREMDSLRDAILRQRITCDRDLAIFACHLHWLSDMIEGTNLGDTVADDVKLLNLACETLFDHVVGEGLADMEEVGGTFRDAAMRCHDRRQDREGEPTDFVEETAA